MSIQLQFPPEQPLGRILSSVAKTYLHNLRHKLNHMDIDRNYYALVIIGKNDGHITQQELGLMLETDKVSIVRVVDYLSEKGYVKRVRKFDDKRKHNLLLTDKAKQALPEIIDAFNDLNRIALSGFSVEEISELTVSIEKIKKNISENTLTT
jgi:MarR family transcriptional regulator, transcriptional regulator for hemolysin